MNLFKTAARVAAGDDILPPEVGESAAVPEEAEAEASDEKTLEFEMPGDQDWDINLWEKLGVGADWERLGRAFYNNRVDVDDSENITLTFPAENEAAVRDIIEHARKGTFGPDVKTYWSAAQEVGTGPSDDDQQIVDEVEGG